MPSGSPQNLRPKSVIEFGCNDGTLIAALEKHGIRSLGVDLAANITEMARQQGRNVVTGAFGPEIVDQLRDQMGQVDLITGSNVFAHNADPASILEAVDALLAPDGVLCLEVMYAGDLLLQRQWDTLYHEHLTFYSLGTLGKALQRFGFEPISAVRIPMHGGSLRLAAARSGHRQVDSSVAELEAWEEELSLNDASTWDGFATRVSTADRRLRGHDAPSVGWSVDLGIWRSRQGDHVGERV